MTRFWIESAVVAAVGFALGVLLAAALAPGSTPVWIALGVTSAVFFHVLFVNQFRGELFWPIVKGRRISLLSPFRHGWHWARPSARHAGRSAQAGQDAKSLWPKRHRHHD